MVNVDQGEGAADRLRLGLWLRLRLRRRHRLRLRLGDAAVGVWMEAEVALSSAQRTSPNYNLSYRMSPS